MNKDVKYLYIAIKDNKVVCFDTNLKNFVEKFLLIEKDARNYDYFYRKFRTGDYFEYKTETNNIYFIQKLS
jgi:hypothetical protein